MDLKDNEQFEKSGGQRENERVYRNIGGCDVKIPGPSGLVIFGASGDLTKRKIIPSLYRLQKNG